ncbi:MAG: rod shape-determining protein MreC [Clostridia bacterium]|nr:rod shape-determining protein MreC [Clostridia bacterium]
MRRFFKNKLAVLGTVLACLAVAVMIYAFVSPSPTPITNLLSVIVTPAQKAASKIGDGISGFFAYFKGVDDLREENEKLQLELARYRELESEYYSAIRENEELRALSELKQKHAGFELEMCAVVSNVDRSFMSSFTIDAGKNDGVKVGDCVITDLGFVGFVSSVALGSSEVTTLLNVESKLAVTNSRTRDVLVAEGSFELASSGLIKLPYLKNDADVLEGDVIETSSVGEKYPSGIIVGTVLRIEREKHGISSYAVVEPAVNVESLHSVYVVKSFEVNE